MQMGNHDRSRIATRYAGRTDQMTILAMILPGVAVTYYGEEIGMEDNTNITWKETKDPQACNIGLEHFQERTRDPNRTPFQWDATKNSGKIFHDLKYETKISII
jgi:alpha-glucosidase